MNCELCFNDIGDAIVILPVKKPSGRLSIMACLKCAENSSAYCKKHKIPHIGFSSDTTTACLVCIEETVKARMTEADSVFDKIRRVLDSEEAEAGNLMEATSMSSCLTGVTPAVSVLRFVATKAFRLHVSIEEVVERVLQEKSVNIILS